MRVVLYDALGREAAVAYDAPLEGQEAVRLALPVRRLAAGLYVVRVEGEQVHATQMLTVVK